MERERLKELHYITPIANVPSILELGILSYRRANEISHNSIAMQDVQNIRAARKVPGARKLHEYANLYLCGRNPMLYKRLGQRRSIAVLRVSPEVLDLPGVAVSDGNAASGYTRFRPGSTGLGIVDEEMTFAQFWTDDDVSVKYEKGRRKCAEVLVPSVVDPGYIVGAYVCSDGVRRQLQDLVEDIHVEIDHDLFFGYG